MFNPLPASVLGLPVVYTVCPGDGDIVGAIDVPTQEQHQQHVGVPTDQEQHLVGARRPACKDMVISHLKRVVRKQRATITKLRNELRKHSQPSASQRQQRFRDTRWKKRAASECNILALAGHDQKMARLAIGPEFKGGGSRYYTDSGGFSLAMRRSLSNVAARGTQFILMRDIHHTTMARWEIRLRAAINAAAMYWYKGISGQMSSHLERDQPGWLFAIHQYRSDATKADLWQRSSLHVTELTTNFTQEAVIDSRHFERTLATLDAKTNLGDVQVVQDKTGLGTLACIRKQLASVGGVGNYTGRPQGAALSDVTREPAAILDLSDDLALAIEAIQDGEAAGVTQPAQASGRAGGRANAADEHPGHPAHPTLATVAPAQPSPSRVLQVWLQTTDAGSDEKKARILVEGASLDLPNVLVFGCDCLAHQ